MAVAIIGGALLIVAEHVVGLANLLELVLRRVVSGILVRMKLHRELAVGLLDLVGRRAFRHTDNLVVVALAGHGEN